MDTKTEGMQTFKSLVGIPFVPSRKNWNLSIADGDGTGSDQGCHLRHDTELTIRITRQASIGIGSQAAHEFNVGGYNAKFNLGAESNAV